LDGEQVLVNRRASEEAQLSSASSDAVLLLGQGVGNVEGCGYLDSHDCLVEVDALATLSERAKDVLVGGLKSDTGEHRENASIVHIDARGRHGVDVAVFRGGLDTANPSNVAGRFAERGACAISRLVGRCGEFECT
jgi:hypothetical protein